jgi:hypothetical protein
MEDPSRGKTHEEKQRQALGRLASSDRAEDSRRSGGDDSVSAQLEADEFAGAVDDGISREVGRESMHYEWIISSETANQVQDVGLSRD